MARAQQIAGQWTVLTLFSGLSDAVFATEKQGGPPTTAAVYRAELQRVLERIPQIFPRVFINVISLPLNINETSAIIPLHYVCQAMNFFDHNLPGTGTVRTLESCPSLFRIL